MTESEAFMQALYNLIDLKIIDLDEYQGLLDNFTTTEELDAYLTAREDITIWQLVRYVIDLQCCESTVIFRRFVMPTVRVVGIRW